MQDRCKLPTLINFKRWSNGVKYKQEDLTGNINKMNDKIAKICSVSLSEEKGPNELFLQMTYVRDNNSSQKTIVLWFINKFFELQLFDAVFHL